MENFLGHDLFFSSFYVDISQNPEFNLLKPNKYFHIYFISTLLKENFSLDDVPLS